MKRKGKRRDGNGRQRERKEEVKKGRLVGETERRKKAERKERKEKKENGSQD